MRVLLVVLAVLAGCKKDSPPPAAPGAAPAPALRPAEVILDGAYHAMQCGPVTAVWSGSDAALKDLPQPAPKAFGVESLAFHFADGSKKGFAPTGQLFFSDWRFDLFSPDCQYVALLADHFGPYHLVKVGELRGYLEGKVKPVHVQALGEKEALVHADAAWGPGPSLEFSASCCGGAQVFRSDVKSGSLERLLDAPAAPKGVRRMASGWEVVP
jgi:hypothetical protein